MPSRPRVASILLVALIATAGPSTVAAQSAGHPAPGQATSAGQDQQLAKQLEELRAQVARLQQALDQQRQAQSPAMPAMGQKPSSGMSMEGMGTMSSGAMGMDMHKGEMGMAPDGMKMPMPMMDDDMGRMSSMAASPSASSGSAMPSSGGMNMRSRGMQLPSASRSMSTLPGNPGASHLYHVGSTGFFLDQAGISLSDDQRSALNKIKERALLERGDADRRIEQAEQELWTLTGADQPDSTKVQAKVREIEQLRSNQRLAFIQTVGEATKVLTADQRTALLGMSGMRSK